MRKEQSALAMRREIEGRLMRISNLWVSYSILCTSHFARHFVLSKKVKHGCIPHLCLVRQKMVVFKAQEYNSSSGACMSIQNTLLSNYEDRIMIELRKKHLFLAVLLYVHATRSVTLTIRQPAILTPPQLLRQEMCQYSTKKAARFLATSLHRVTTR